MERYFLPMQCIFDILFLLGLLLAAMRVTQRAEKKRETL